jgi:Tfp pilus assembly protein PilF
MTKTVNERIAEADQKGNNWLYRANQAAARGEHEKAERMYEKGQKWLDLANKLLGNGE